MLELLVDFAGVEDPESGDEEEDEEEAAAGSEVAAGDVAVVEERLSVL